MNRKYRDFKLGQHNSHHHQYKTVVNMPILSSVVAPTVVLNHCGRVTQICVSKQTIIGSDNGLSPGRRQAIIWTNGGILLTGTLGTNLSEILSEIRTFSFKKMHLKMSSVEWWPFYLGFNVLTHRPFGCVAVKVYFRNSLYRIIAWTLAVKLHAGKCHRNAITWSQH